MNGLLGGERKAARWEIAKGHLWEGCRLKWF